MAKAHFREGEEVLGEERQPLPCPEHSGVEATMTALQRDVTDIKADLKTIVNQALTRVQYPVVIVMGLLCTAVGGLSVWALTR